MPKAENMITSPDSPRNPSDSPERTCEILSPSCPFTCLKNGKKLVFLPVLLLLTLTCVVLGQTRFLPAETAENSSRQISQDVFPKVVKLYGAGGLSNLANYGTGILVSPDGHILTIWNHLLDTEQVVVVLDSGRRLPARFVGGAGDLGLAILKIEVKNAPCFDLSEIQKRGSGTPVLGFSNMFNVAAGDEPVSVIHGVIAAVTPLDARRGRFDSNYKGDVYLVDAVMNNPGAAGGSTHHSGWKTDRNHRQRTARQPNKFVDQLFDSLV